MLNEERRDPVPQTSQKPGQFEGSLTSGAGSLHNKVYAGRWRSSVLFEQLEVVCGHLVPSPADEHNGTR